MNLSALLKNEGAVRELDEVLEIDGVSLAEGFVPIEGGAKVVGAVKNIGQELLLDATVSMTVVRACDRCLNDTRTQTVFSVSEHLLPETRVADAEEKDGIVLVEGELDLVELVKSRLILHLPIKHLCSEDCKGLCAQCGADLNVAPCIHCSAQESEHEE